MAGRGSAVTGLFFGRTITLRSKIPLPVSGAEKLRSELQRVKTVARPAAIAAIGEARLHGDISENAEYDAAKDRQGFIEGRIARIEDTLSKSNIVDPRPE